MNQNVDGCDSPSIIQQIIMPSKLKNGDIEQSLYVITLSQQKYIPHMVKTKLCIIRKKKCLNKFSLQPQKWTGFLSLVTQNENE